MFPKRKNKQRDNATVSSFTMIASAFFRYVQEKFAHIMEARTKRLSARKLKLLFIFFCVAGCAWSIYSIAISFTGNAPVTALRIDAIHPPVNEERKMEERLTPRWYIPEEEYQKIMGCVHYLDSLKRYNAARYDSIMKSRPGLMDSLMLLENLYQSQLKK